MGGVHPAQALSITLDVGTDNEDLLNDPLYVVSLLTSNPAATAHVLYDQGWPNRRVRGEEYDKFVDQSVPALLTIDQRGGQPFCTQVRSAGAASLPPQSPAFRRFWCRQCQTSTGSVSR